LRSAKAEPVDQFNNYVIDAVESPAAMLMTLATAVVPISQAAL
jgi:hypothetical protein